MEIKGNILFRYEHVKMEKISLIFLTVIGIIFFGALIYVNGIHIIKNIYFVIVIVWAVWLYFIYSQYLKTEQDFAVTKDGFYIPTNHLYPLRKSIPRITFLPFSAVKKIICPRHSSSMVVETHTGKNYFIKLNHSENQRLIKILQDTGLQVEKREKT